MADAYPNPAGFQETLTDLLQSILTLRPWSHHGWQRVMSNLIALILTILRIPLEYTGKKLQASLNDARNGKYVTVGETGGLKEKVYPPGTKVERSVVGFIDLRVDLEKNTKDRFPLVSALARANADVCAISAKLAYEDSTLVEDVVKNQWNQGNEKGHFKFDGYFKGRQWKVVDGCRLFTNKFDTNAYVFTRAHSQDQLRCRGDTAAVVVAFRGTEPFNYVDWITDFSFSWVELDGLGRIHKGFLNALGISDSKLDTFNSYITAAAASNGADGREDGNGQDAARLTGEYGSDLGRADGPHRTTTSNGTNTCESMEDARKKFERKLIFYSGGQIDEEKTPLYFVLREKVLGVLKKNSDVKLFITGHSLGGALGALFTALLVAESPLARKKLKALYTFGQPRVGDLSFIWHLHNKVSDPELRYIRILHCNDLVARVPFDDDLFQFKHIGPWFRSSPTYRLQMGAFNDQPVLQFLGAYRTAWLELFHALLRMPSKDFRETGLSLFVRFAGLFVPWLADHSPTNYVNAVRLGLPVDGGQGSPGEPQAVASQQV